MKGTGLRAKRSAGGFLGRAPDGYINVESKTPTELKSQNGKYTRWIEPDPQRFHIWREAWELLLDNKHTLEAICQILYERGYTYRSGRAFVYRVDGQWKANCNTLSGIFHNWFYAGWVVSKDGGIAPKTLRGQWQPTVSTEEFEYGLEILDKHNHVRTPQRKHDYLLQGLVYARMPYDQSLVRLAGSTPNPRRKSGGTAYYCVSRSDVNILCQVVDAQIAAQLAAVQVAPDLLPAIRAAYTSEIAEKLGHRRPDERQRLHAKLKAIDEEEARALRLYAAGKITEHIWNNLWTEWQDRRRKLTMTLEGLQAKQEIHMGNLDAALAIIAKVGMLYNTLERSDQKDLLREMVERVVVNLDGKIIRLELQPPFAYLREVTQRVTGDGGKTKTSPEAGQCSNKLLSGDSGGT